MKNRCKVQLYFVIQIVKFVYFAVVKTQYTI